MGKRVTDGRLSFVDGRWTITETPPHVAIRLKSVFPSIPKAKIGSYTLPGSDHAAHELLWFCDLHPLDMSVADRRRLSAGRKRHLEGRTALERMFHPDYVAPRVIGLAEGYELYNYQALVGEVLALVPGMLLGDDVGLGKTNSAIGAMLEREGRLPCAVVVQSNLVEQWKDRIEAVSMLRVHVIKKGTPYELPVADVYVFSYGKTHGWANVFEQRFFRFVVFDEPQELRNGEGTAKGDACRVLSDCADSRMGLSATPVFGYGIEMHTVMSYLAPGVLGSREEFVREWCKDDKMVADPDALGSYLRSLGIMLRRTDKDVGREMPEPNKLVRYVDWRDEKARDAYALAESLAVKGLTGSFVERGRALRKLDALERQVTGVAKAHGVAAYTRILLEAGLPVLLAGWHREVYDIWLEELADFSPVMFTGTESRKQKRESKEAFVSGRSRLMIISNRSGVGLDGLQHGCEDVVIGELDWSPAIIKQLIGRLRRAGNQRRINAHFAITNEGSDPMMMEVLGLKASQQYGINDPGAEPEITHTDDTRLRRLAETVIARRRALEAA